MNLNIDFMGKEWGSMKYTIRHLQVFLAVAKEQSISRAAVALSLSQSATSAALQEFESRYDIQLFDRAGKRLRLNSFGESIRVKAETVMAHLLGFEEELMGQDEFGHLRVGASFTIGNYLAVKHLATYMQEHPEAKVEMEVGSTPEVVAKVLNFHLDIGLIEAELHHDDLQLQPWREDKMVAFCRPDHPLAGKSQLSNKDILSAGWILRESDSGHRQTFDRSMQGLLPDLHIVLELTHNEAIKNAVKAGLGVGCLSEIAVADEIQQGLLVPLVIKGRPMNRRFYFVTHKKAAVNRAAQSWMDICKG
ncbi:LysR substrate-binding domain-containing protein [Pseudomaricurvus albidus]|uniref:LysR substrate-binding domain-containing protein n=1 Tax=Pseudomaricurvus albidus TaxID=2842452 RepID=UPI001F2A9C6C|nr:LysR substrate-binding domain-containing protein [Aestuariicella albida]